MRTANAQAKVINLTTNLTSLTIFLVNGQALLPLGLAAAVCNMAGNYVGAGLAMTKGSRITRPVIILVLALLFKIFGAKKVESGKIFLNGKETRMRDTADALDKGVGLIPEDRKQHGVFLPMTIAWNVSISSIKKKLMRGLVVDKKKEKALSVALKNGAEAALCIIDKGVPEAANRFNGSHP